MAPLQVPLDRWGNRSRLLLVGAVTELPWPAWRGSRVRALSSVGALEVLAPLKAKTALVAAGPGAIEERGPAETEPGPQDSAEAEEESEMLNVTSEAVENGEDRPEPKRRRRTWC